MIRIILTTFMLFASFSSSSDSIGALKRISMHPGEGKLVVLDKPLYAAFVSNPNVADISSIRPGIDRAFQIFAKNYGISDLQVVDKNNQTIVNYRIVVEPNIKALNDNIAKLFPKENVEVAYSKGALIVSGSASDNFIAKKIIELISGYAKDSNHTLVDKIVVTSIDKLNDIINKMFPASSIKITHFSETLIVSGNTDTTLNAKLIMELVKDYVKGMNRADKKTDNTKEKTLVNKISVANSEQVNLKVRVIEVETTDKKRLGIKWGFFKDNQDFITGIAGGGGFTDVAGSEFAFKAKKLFDLSVLIDALSSKGIIKTLAEPNLTTLSGKTANFLAGGEYPYAIPDGNGGNTIAFKEYGIKLSFTPTILGRNNIVLNIKPEVSTLAVVPNIAVPILNIRKAETTVELASGQSMAIAGFISKNSSKNMNKIPILGDLPGIGDIFKSKDLNSGTKELIIIVTPYLVNPTSPNRLAEPKDDMDTRGLDFEAFLNHDFFQK
jgi:pilus assembly protein CpaC